MKVTTELSVVEVGGEEVQGLRSGHESVLIESHWNRHDQLIILKYKNINITLSAQELQKAIENAQNKQR